MALVTTWMNLADTVQREVNQTERGSQACVELKKERKENVQLIETSRTVVPRGWRVGDTVGIGQRVQTSSSKMVLGSSRTASGLQLTTPCCILDTC